MQYSDCDNVNSHMISLDSAKNIKKEGAAASMIAKIPVVLAEKSVQIDVEAIIDFKSPYFDIKRIKKDVYLTQCKLILTTEMASTGKLFIEGYVRKNIEYTTAECVDPNMVNGGVYHTTVNVPFKAVTDVEYEVPPVVYTRKPPEEIQLICNKGCSESINCNGCIECDEGILGPIPCEQNFSETLGFTEKPYCELEEAKIYEADIHKNPVVVQGTCCYTQAVEKMVVYLKIKVLQNQQINVGNDNARC